MELLQYTVSPHGGDRQWDSYNALRHGLRVVVKAISAIDCLTAWVQWALQLLQCTASMPQRSLRRLYTHIAKLPQFPNGYHPKTGAEKPL